MVKTLSSLSLALLLAGGSATHAPVWQPEGPRVSAGIKLPLYNVQDTIYYAKMQFGSPPQTMRMNFDSVESDVGVVAVKSPGHNVYNHSASSTYKPDGRHASMRYNVTGVLARDRVVLHDDVVADDQYFVEVTDLGGYRPYYSSLRFDGWFGFGANQSQSVDGVPTMIRAMAKSGIIEQPCLGISMPRDKNGFVLFGAQMMEPISAIDVSAHSNTWGLNVSKITIGEKEVPLGSASYAALDTSMVFISGPREAVDAIAQSVGGTSLGSKGYLYSVPCNADIPDLSFWSTGPDAHAVFTIPKEELVGNQISESDCILSLLSDPTATEWTLGLPVFHSYYFGFCWDPFSSGARFLVGPQV